MNPAALGRFRAALGQAERDVPLPEGAVSRVELERHYASRNWTNAYRVLEAGFTALAETYRDAVIRHGEHAQHLEQEEEAAL